MATLLLVARPYWLSAWFLRACAVPFVLVDDVEQRVRWGRPVRLDVAPGRRLVGVGIRYRGARSLLGYRPVSIDARSGKTIELIAQNGPLNSDPFFLRVRR